MNHATSTHHGRKLGVVLSLVIGLVVALPICVRAQNSQGTILGHVTDSSGAAVPGAKMSARNVNTGVSHHFTTTGGGDYVFVDLIPGTYQVRVEASGFKSGVSSKLTLEVDQTLRQNFSLLVGEVQDEVTVTADSQMVQTDNTTTGNVLDQRTIEDLPSSGRDFNNLLNLTAGATNFSGGSQSFFALHGLNANFTEVSVNGARPDSVSFVVDGVSDTDSFFTTASNVPSEFSIQEVKVQTGLYSAEYGQGSGQINVAIKSGTNQWHGQAYDFIQNDMFNPRSPLQQEQNTYDGTTTPTKLPFKQNQFGGTLGGPGQDTRGSTTGKIRVFGSLLTMAAGAAQCPAIKSCNKCRLWRNARAIFLIGPLRSMTPAPRAPRTARRRGVQRPVRRLPTIRFLPARSVRWGRSSRTCTRCPTSIVPCLARTT